MGSLLTLGVAWSATHIMPLALAIALGAIVSLVAWRVRETKQKNWQWIVWHNFDLIFIDIGVVVGVLLSWRFF
jgi:hypothetical protein